MKTLSRETNYRMGILVDRTTSAGQSRVPAIVTTGACSWSNKLHHYAVLAANEETMERWEYKTIKVEAKGMMGGVVDTDGFDALLNGLGAQGWNLVSVFDTNMVVQGATREIVAVFKRSLG